MRGRMFQVTNAQEVERVVADCCRRLMTEDLVPEDAIAPEPHLSQPCAS
jgi:hypothetical protein